MAGFADVDRIAQLAPACFPHRKCRLGALRDESLFLLSEGRVEVQHERIGIPAKFGNDERHALCHQARDERDIAGQTVEL